MDAKSSLAQASAQACEGRVYLELGWCSWCGVGAGRVGALGLGLRGVRVGHGVSVWCWAGSVCPQPGSAS